MISSGTYTFQPQAGEVFLAALAMCGVRRPSVTNEHLVDATFHANMLMVDLSNRNPWQFALETQPQVLTAGVASYSLTNRTIAIAVAYIETTSGTTTTARVLGPISASEYAAIPNKGSRGFPSTYWFNLQTSQPTITLYLTPDSANTYTLQLQTFRQLQDISPASGQTLDAPYRFLDAFTVGLAARLALIYAPDKAANYDALYERRLGITGAQDQERVAIYITPGLGSYFR